MSPPVKFYRQGDSFGEFSNFHPSPFELDGETWPTTEHYFQAQKFAHLDDRQYVDKVRLASSASDAAKLGRKRSWPLRPDWEGVKDDTMRRCVFEKFRQHPDLWELLDSTGDRMIIEHTRNDTYWADGGGDGRGKNMLGIILMETRDKIRKLKAEDVTQTL
ncbi:hypothetical protein DFQ26_004843 [Actinomortierella ambigua]|nr:hypothetical protein DFQ26_004843 [Actinomortierella ambigua]